MIMQKKLVLGIVAHVDAGKTTLSEALLYTSGSIRTMGRVDNKDAFLDNYELERERGITIFSKQAKLSFPQMQITLLDTPGHVDFSAEMERTLQVLDYAILVISGADGIQSHTHTLWNLLRRYQIPVFIFINKMDQKGTDKQVLLKKLKEGLEESCIDFQQGITQNFLEEVAMCEEDILEEFLENGTVCQEEIKRLIQERKVFPCFFGSALKLQGIKTLIQGMEEYMKAPDRGEEFGAKIFKITRDSQGNRLTHLKVTGGTLNVRTALTKKQEKINQIRIYSGEKYETVNQVKAGSICAVTGLTKTCPGQGLGIEEDSKMPVLEPVLIYQMQLSEENSITAVLPKLRQLEEEEPELHIVWNETLQELQVQLMGEVQIEVLKHTLKERFGILAEFGTGSIVYRETITEIVEGIGHFEPLRHYAEVHLLLEPGEAGSGLEFALDCSEEMLSKNWQKQVLHYLEAKEHKGVLTGCAITDMKITLAAGRAHQKHTEGGDFKQATYRAIRQGLMQGKSVLLEPYYKFTLELPTEVVGHAMMDIEKMHGVFAVPQQIGEMSVLTGKAPVSQMQEYTKEVIAYTKGHGKLTCQVSGYEPCENQEEVIAQIGYDAQREIDDPASSVFCAHGAGFVVSWDKVWDYMHLESILKVDKRRELQESTEEVSTYSVTEKMQITTEEIDEILAKTGYANVKKDFIPHKGIGAKQKEPAISPVTRHYQKSIVKEEYLLVDGYNIIFAWEELKELAVVNMDGARGRLLDILCNYQGSCKCTLIVVFDAYRVQGHVTECIDYHNIHVVYTKEAETADQYIEKFAYENKEKYKVTVATSDGLEQIIIRGQGCFLMSAREFWEEIQEMKEKLEEEYMQPQKGSKRHLLDEVSADTREQLKNMPNDEGCDKNHK